VSTVLHFSGGKDSLACLYLLEPRWHEIIVAWVNTGAAFPETLALMERVRALVPDFREIKSEQTIEREGYPVDVLPVAATPLGYLLSGNEGRRFQSRYACCQAALWVPLMRAMKEWGATVVIRGQKRVDRRRAPITSGAFADGIEYQFPLEDWSDADVFRYLAERGIELPANYAAGMGTGLDCWNCTAYLDENAGRLEYMREHHRAKHDLVRAVLSDYTAVLERELTPLLTRGP
jgi:3'-phosphoadenosine 5'-phosphosulfate sulfotransferase (PAPS reductase)/FAD synthetase